jgi:hypothetical protein
MKAVLLVAVLLPATALADEWGVGLRATGERVDPKDDGPNGIGMGGGGLLVRWRISRRFGLELGVDGVTGKLADGAFERKTSSAQLAATFHLTPGSRWDFYLLLGVGGATDRVTFVDASGAEMEQEFKETVLRLGGGLEYRWEHLGIGAEVAAVGMARNDSDAALAGDAVPRESGGGQWSVVATYYF